MSKFHWSLKSWLSVWLLVLLVPAQGQVPAAPPFALKDLSGRTIQLKQYKGKVVLLNFWATWCPPCLAEMPELVKLQTEYQAQGLQIIGITYPGEEARQVRQLARQFKLNYPVILGTERIAEQYEIGEVLPVTLVLDRAGVIRERILGILTPEEFEEKIKPLLAEERVSGSQE